MKTRYTREILDTLQRDYALRDSKGREIGGRFVIANVTYSPAPEGEWGYDREPGTIVTGVPHATRNGESYGASQRMVEYPSVEAARAAAEVYFKAAAKRAGRR